MEGRVLAGVAVMGFPSVEDIELHKALAKTAGSGKTAGPGCGTHCSRECGRYALADY